MATLHKFVIIIFLATVYSKSVQRDSKEELARYIEEKRHEINQRYRLHYHVAGPVGWINDPNGFSYYKGEYHLFYQFYPYDSVHGPMHWGHVTSMDLVHWKELPTALIPDEEECFSGSAVIDGNTLILMYTGHVEIDSEHYNQTQYLAFSDDGVDFTKYEGNPVIPSEPNGSPDFRDPKAWRFGGYWYVVIGSKTSDDRGRVLLYRSENMINWEYLTILAESSGDLGYMWECPDFFELDGKFVLLMSPQGMKPQGDRYHNLHQTGYIVGDFNYNNFTFTPQGSFQELDYGHDFYAAQTTEEGGKRYLVAWFNMWEAPYPEDVDGWMGALTLVRELKLHGDRIVMKPLDAMIELREDLVFDGEFRSNQTADFGQTAEIIIEGNLEEDMEFLIEGRDGGGKVWVRWAKSGKVAVDRGSADVRQVEWVPIGSQFLRVFLDASSLELFCGEGEVVFSSRVYPTGTWKLTNLSNQKVRISAFSLNRSVPL